jgi:hypothetical protein
MAINTIGTGRGAVSAFQDGDLKDGSGLKCFTDETLVQSDAGPMPIADIRAGDLVYSLDEESGEVELHEVTALYKRESPSLYKVGLGGEVIETTR